MAAKGEHVRRARGRRRLPGLALLHHLFRPGRGRDAEPHRPRRHGLRQPRVRPRPRAAGQVHRDRRLPGHLRQRRRLRRQPARAARRSTISCSRSAARRWRSSAPPRPDTAEISTPGPTVSFRAPVDYLRGEVAALEAEGVDKIILLSHLGDLRRRGGGGGGARHRPHRRRPQPHALLQHRRGRALQVSADGRRPRRPRRADRAGRRLLQVPRPRRRSPSTTPASSPRPPATPASSTPASRPTPTSSPASRSSPARSRS